MHLSICVASSLVENCMRKMHLMYLNALDSAVPKKNQGTGAEWAALNGWCSSKLARS